jgi:hypothetical protein
LSDCSRTAPRRTTATLSAFSRTISPPTQHPIARARVRAQTRINIPRISCVPICSNATKLRRFNGRKSQLLIAHDHLGRSPPYSSAASSERSPTGGDLKSFCNRAICLLVRRAASPGSREHDATSDGVPFDRVGPNPERLASLTWPSPSSHPQNICWARRRPSDVAARNMPQRQPPLRPAARNDCSSGLTPSRFWTSPTRWSDGSRLTLRVATGTNKWWKRSKAIASAGEQKRTTKCCLAQEIFELVFISRSKNTDLT